MAVLQKVPLGFQWPTVDPFLFCVHHLDHYPAGDHRLGPVADLSGRNLGQDFEGLNGWRMYHGQVVPGFPSHPHRGFETLTYVRQGLVDHADSLGAAARYGRGDAQWMTAGSGIVHAEMFPLLDRDGPNTLELFQIWINLPAVDKMVDPHFSMLWDHQIPRLTINPEGPDGPGVQVTVIAGNLAGTDQPPSPPPHSWAARTEADVAVWHITMDPGTTWSMPAALSPETVRVLYVFEGSGLSVDGEMIGASTGAVVTTDQPQELAASDRVEILVLQGRPIAEPVARYGPFVMNSEAEIAQAFSDYQRTEFGGWPWPVSDPTHGLDSTRFARHADGRVEQSAQV
jgi:redox-sensitive bicupin YhaK (pirin superfamily)